MNRIEGLYPADDEGKKLHQRIEAVMNVAGLGEHQRVTLNGQEITHCVQRIQIDSKGGELMRCVLFLMLNENGRPAVHYPEQLANVVVVEDFEAVHTRMLLVSATRWLKSMWGVDDPSTYDKLGSDQKEFLMRIDQATQAGPTPMERLGEYIARTRRPLTDEDNHAASQ